MHTIIKSWKVKTI